MGKSIDMTGWVMSEHGVPDSRLTVIGRSEDYINPANNTHIAQWLCECNCKDRNKVVVREPYLKSGHTKSCGCLSKEKASQRWTGNIYGQQKQLCNEYKILENYGIIYAANTNEEIYFDIENKDKLLRYRWNIGVRGYPVAHINGKIMTMHVYLGFKYHDHHDRNKLNNRAENLIPCTNQENVRNKSIQSNNTSGFVGVSWNKKRCLWEAYIAINRKKIRLGHFTNKREAIIARLHAEQKYFGDFAPQKHLFEEYGIE